MTKPQADTHTNLGWVGLHEYEYNFWTIQTYKSSPNTPNISHSLTLKSEQIHISGAIFMKFESHYSFPTIISKLID